MNLFYFIFLFYFISWVYISQFCVNIMEFSLFSLRIASLCLLIRKTFLYLIILTLFIYFCNRSLISWMKGSVHSYEIHILFINCFGTFLFVLIWMHEIPLNLQFWEKKDNLIMRYKIRIERNKVVSCEKVVINFFLTLVHSCFYYITNYVDVLCWL